MAILGHKPIATLEMVVKPDNTIRYCLRMVKTHNGQYVGEASCELPVGMIDDIVDDLQTLCGNAKDGF